MGIDFPNPPLANGQLFSAPNGTVYQWVTPPGVWNDTGQAGIPSVSPLTTRGDLYYYGPAGNTRLPLGVTNTVLGSDGTDAVWAPFGATGTQYTSAFGVSVNATAFANANGINAAIAKVGAMGGGTVVHDVVGVCMVTVTNPGAADIDLRALYFGVNNVELRFAPGSALKLADNSNCIMVAVGSYASPVLNTRIDGAVLDGNRVNQIAPTDADKHYSGIQVWSACQGTTITNFNIHDCQYYGIGFEIRNFTNCRVSNGTITNTGADGMDCKDGILSGDTPINQNNVIENVRVSNHGLAMPILTTAQTGFDLRGGWTVRNVAVTDYGDGVNIIVGIRFQQEAFNGASPPTASSLPLQTSSVSNFYIRPATSVNTWGLRPAAPHVRIENGEVKNCAYGLRGSGLRMVLSDVSISVPANGIGLSLATAVTGGGAQYCFFDGIKIVGDGTTTTGIESYDATACQSSTFSGCMVSNHLLGLHLVAGSTSNKFFGGAFASNVTTVTDAGIGNVYHAVEGIPRHVAFAARASAQTFNSATRAQVVYGTETIDTGNNFASNIFVCPTTGIYQFDAQLTNTAGGLVVGDVWSLTIEQQNAGGVTLSNPVSRACVSTSAIGSAVLRCSALFSMTATDTVQAFVTRESGTGSYVVYNISAANCFNGVRVARE